MARTPRQLHHLKGFRVQIGDGIPKPNEGSEGEMTVRTTRSGLKLFIKFKNKWYVFGAVMGIPGGSNAEEILSAPNLRPSVLGSGSGRETFINSKTKNLELGGNIKAPIGTFINRDGVANSGLYFGRDLTAKPGHAYFGGNVFIEMGSKLYLSDATLAADPDGIANSSWISASHDEVVQHYVDGVLYLELDKTNTRVSIPQNTLIDGDLDVNDDLNVTDGTITADVIKAGASANMTLTDSQIDITTGPLLIDVPGDLSFDIEGDINIDTAGGSIVISDATPDSFKPSLAINSTRDDQYGPILQLQVQRDNPTAADTLGYIYFNGKDSAGQGLTYASIEGILESPTNTDEEGKLSFNVCAGTATPAIGLTLTGNDGVIDTLIGLGATSMTTIAGDLDIDGDRITSASHLSIVPSSGDVTIDVGRHINLDCGTGAIFATKAGGTYTPTVANEVIPKHYLDANTYHFIKCGFSNTGTSKNYLPIAASDDLREGTNPTGLSERYLFICPYNGSVEKVLARSTSACDSSVLGIHIASNGTEMPSATATQSVTVDMAVDDTAYEFDFASAGTNTFTKGQVIAFSFDPTSTMNDMSFTIVLKFDVST